MRRSFLLATVSAAIIACAATLPSRANAEDGFTLKKKPMVAMIYYGPKTDVSWTQSF